MNTQKRKAVLVESWELMRSFLEEGIKKDERYELEKILPDANSARNYIKNNKVDLLIMEIPSENGEEILEKAAGIKMDSPFTKVILTTLTSSARMEEEAKKAGVDRIWQKEISEKSLNTVLGS